MSGHYPFSRLIAKMSPERRAEVARLTEELEAELRQEGHLTSTEKSDEGQADDHRASAQS